MTEITIPERRKGIDPHAPRSSLHPADRLPPEVYYPPDSDTDLYCPMCVPEQAGGTWTHDRACVLGRRARTA